MLYVSLIFAFVSLRAAFDAATARRHLICFMSASGASALITEALF